MKDDKADSKYKIMVSNVVLSATITNFKQSAREHNSTDVSKTSTPIERMHNEI